MDINRLMRKIDRHLGITTLSLDKFNPQILDVLNDDTLRTISQFFPYEYYFKMNLGEQTAEHVSGDEYIYYIKDKYLDTDDNIDIISIRYVTGAGTFEQWNAPLQTFNVDAMILEAQASNIRSLMNISTKSFAFLSPNRLKLKGYGRYETVHIIAKINYPNWGSVPESLSIAVEQLAKLDVKIFLWNTVKLYNKMESADGSVDMMIDDWANAETERQELLDSWRDKAFSNFTRLPLNYE